jgi:hypothetical protein
VSTDSKLTTAAEVSKESAGKVSSIEISDYTQVSHPSFEVNTKMPDETEDEHDSVTDDYDLIESTKVSLSNSSKNSRENSYPSSTDFPIFITTTNGSVHKYFNESRTVPSGKYII